jgi:hypothetical protein
MPHSATDLARVIRRQAEGCARLDSPLWARLLNDAAGDIEAGGPLWDLLRDWDGEIEQGAIGLRVTGGLHYLARPIPTGCGRSRARSWCSRQSNCALSSPAHRRPTRLGAPAR